ncbi:MAG: cardiolipin synthase ClsB [Deltaproteobacteria bacterium]|nr:cardiolipin synthase ClsB [Deltaproteobacteria bacterium]
MSRRQPSRGHAIATRLRTEFRRWARGLSPEGILYLQSLSDYRIAGGNHVEMLVDGTRAIPAMIETVRAARRRILYETYIHRNDATGRAFADALREAALRGVEVFVIYDDFGSNEARELLDGLVTVGAHVLPFHPVTLLQSFRKLNARNHRKILVADNRIGFTGGCNIGDEYMDAPGRPAFRDTHLRIEGPAVHQLTLSFFKCWFEQTGERINPISPPVPAESGRSKVLITTETLRRERAALRRSYIFAFKAARERLLITNSYFVPDRKIREAIISAARRGIRVRLIIPGVSDVPMTRFASWGIYAELLRAGVEIYEYLGRILHAKTAVIDQGLVICGSTNLDHRSFLHNQELQAMVFDTGVAEQFALQFEQDLRDSDQLTPEEYEQWPWWKRLLGRFAWSLRRLM